MGFGSRFFRFIGILACIQTAALSEENGADPSITRDYYGNLTNPNSKVFLYSGMDQSNAFFLLALNGCRKEALALNRKSKDNYECLNIMPPKGDGEKQAEILKAHMPDPGQDHNLLGVLVAVHTIEPLLPVIDAYVNRGIPVVTFDSDASESKRLKYIGTDQHFFGASIAKAMIQLHPDGGTFAAFYMGHLPNLRLRYKGFVDALEENAPGLWEEVEGTPVPFFRENPSSLVKRLYAVAEEHSPTAIVPLQGFPQRLGDTWVNFTLKYPDITYIAGDDFPIQIEQLQTDAADGLVGQLPFEMGMRAVQFFTRYHAGTLTAEDKDPMQPLGTNLVSHVRVPIELPYLKVDENHLKSLKYVGFAAFGIVATLSFTFIGWAIVKRSAPIVKMAQPIFLIMVALGVFVWSSASIPLSFDDQDREFSDAESIAVCMAPPWLFFIGFTITFSALFAKIRRVNKLFHSTETFQRVIVSHREVLTPFVILVTCNIAVLASWTVFHPMKYVRQNHSGTDGWNRVISTYGICESEGSWPYGIGLAVLNLGLVLLANWQAYEARRLEQEIAESKYIGLIMGSMVQAVLLGGPLLALVDDNPQAYYMVTILLNFLISLVTLLLIFIPKIVQSSRGSEEQMSRVKDAIRMAAAATPSGENQKSSSQSTPSNHANSLVQRNSGPTGARAHNISMESYDASLNGLTDREITGYNSKSHSDEPQGLMNDMASSPVKTSMKEGPPITRNFPIKGSSWADVNMSTFEHATSRRSACDAIGEDEASD